MNLEWSKIPKMLFFSGSKKDHFPFELEKHPCYTVGSVDNFRYLDNEDRIYVCG